MTTLWVAFLASGGIGIYSIASGNSVFIYSSVNREKNPILYWIATTLFCSLALACLVFIVKAH